jgi:uncharacterized membrane protein
VKAGLALAAAFAALIILICAAPAAASFKVCNKTSYNSIAVAFAVRWFDSYHNVQNGSKGWFTIAKGDCSVLIPTDISAYDMFIYAYAASAKSKTWSGSHQFCLDPKRAFTYDGPSSQPPCSAGNTYGMLYVETYGDESFTEDLTD